MLFLNNVSEAFRNTCLEHYKLDPAHFCMSLRLAWQVCLKETGIRLELLIDPDTLLMFEKGIRGGITQAVHRYAKASNKCIGKPEGESSFLQYLDASNLHGSAMIVKLPTGGFKWFDVSKFTSKKIDRLAEDDSKGYLLEVDVRYHKKLHDLHNDLRFMCEKMVINKSIRPSSQTWINS